MATWKCGVYVVVGTIVIVLTILLNFDFLPKRRLSEELELTTKSSSKGSTTSKGIPSTVKVPTKRTTSNLHSTAAKVRLLKFNAKCIYFLRNYTEGSICMITAMFPTLKTRLYIAQNFVRTYTVSYGMHESFSSLPKLVRGTNGTVES